LVVAELPETLIADCGDLAWLVTDVVAYLREMRERYALVAAIGQQGGG
jgi:hypothetical protein